MLAHNSSFIHKLAIIHPVSQNLMDLLMKFPKDSSIQSKDLTLKVSSAITAAMMEVKLLMIQL